jgi:hypothetical protein
MVLRRRSNRRWLALKRVRHLNAELDAVLNRRLRRRLSVVFVQR